MFSVGKMALVYEKLTIENVCSVFIPDIHKFVKQEINGTSYLSYFKQLLLQSGTDQSACAKGEVLSVAPSCKRYIRTSITFFKQI